MVAEPFVLAIDQGTTGTTCLVIDRRAPHARARLRGAAAALPAARLGRARPGGDLGFGAGRRRARSRRRGLERRRASRDRDHESARDRPPLGSRDRPAAPPGDRLAGPAHGRALPRASRRAHPRADGARPRSVLLGDQARVASGARPSRRTGAAFGTIDSWLVWKLTAGERHVIDVSNASRTLLAALDSADWDDELLALFGVTARRAARRSSSSSGVRRRGRAPRRADPDRRNRGRSASRALRPGVLRARRREGDARHRLLRAREHRQRTRGPAPHGLVRTVAWRLGGEEVVYALEGSIFVAGAALGWLRDGLGLLEDASESDALAQRGRREPRRLLRPGAHRASAPRTGTLPHAASLAGLTRGARREHLVRAALEAVAYQTA